MFFPGLMGVKCSSSWIQIQGGRGAGSCCDSNSSPDLGLESEPKPLSTPTASAWPAPIAISVPCPPTVYPANMAPAQGTEHIVALAAA